jgi:hypothetical protein
VCWPLLCLCRPFCIFVICLDSNPESCRSKQVRYQLSHPSPILSHPSLISNEYGSITLSTSKCKVESRSASQRCRSTTLLLSTMLLFVQGDAGHRERRGGGQPDRSEQPGQGALPAQRRPQVDGHHLCARQLQDGALQETSPPLQVRASNLMVFHLDILLLRHSCYPRYILEVLHLSCISSTKSLFFSHSESN